MKERRGTVGNSLQQKVQLGVITAAIAGLVPAFAVAQQAPAAAPLVCASTAGEHNVCPGDTSAGVALMKSTGPAACLLGKTWGYDDKGVWVADGCSGEFQLGRPAEAGAPAPAPVAAPVQTPEVPAQDPPPTPQAIEPIEQWGDFTPGDGFLVGKSSAGALSISGYALLRYLNQFPGEQAFTDHLGNEQKVDGRNDIWPHRRMVFFKGWVGSPRLIYAVTFWTVNSTDQRAIFGNIGYQFSRRFSLYGGFNGNPGTRSLQGSHPFWLGHDRVMADEFFRPFFGSGIWAQGEVAPGLWYNAELSNNNSSLGVKSSQLDRKFTYGGSIWWMPTTKEFGPKGAYGDWERHERVATRFGFSTTWSPEQRFTTATGSPDNTTLRPADSLNVFDAGSLAPGVTVDTVDYQILSFDAGMKYKSFFLQTEIYNRWLDNFKADGSLPVSSAFGYYIGGQKGTSFSTAFSVFF